ncbi:SDR family oxidoreductase [Luteimonas sp. R10]|uniref:SDR family oxidoreductase n=1 Tax=Luteimonas sp. R10 TaxID=3108176 RepID=UPI00308D6987|nr:SDR family oxidoreductase [Luteimonas sp. R10]
MHRPIADQVIVITGASSGIGLCTALRAAGRGAKVVAIARSRGVLARLAEEIEGAGGQMQVIAADVADRPQMRSAAEHAVDRFGRIDTWINNAGVSIYGRLEDVTRADGLRLFETNFWGVVNGALAALPYLRKRGGALINLGGDVAEGALALQGMYTSSKHAVKGFTDALREELEQLDRAPISVVLIQPAVVNTPLLDNARNYLPGLPQRRRAALDPVRVADAILHAAVHGGRNVKIGVHSRLDVAVSRWFRKLPDRSAGALRRQPRERVLERLGALHVPSARGRIRGLLE